MTYACYISTKVLFVFCNLLCSSPEHAATMAERTILSVGLLCLDLISVVEEYPKEDSDQR